MGSHFFGLKLNVSIYLLQNSVFLSLVIYFQKPKGTSTHQAWSFVSNFHCWLKCCSCLVEHMLYDSGTGIRSWPKNTELLLYVGRKTIWRIKHSDDAGETDVQVVFKSALLKGVCPRNVSKNCINPKRSVFLLNVSILKENTSTGFSVMSYFILSFCSRPFWKLQQIHRGTR